MNQRRGQQQRSASTQRALLQATIECLVDHGYAGTSTRMVADRARVSRGAQTHHYPTKRDLVVAAIEQLFADQANAFAEAFELVPVHERTFDRAIEALWEIVSGPAYAATLEVIVAGRTDDELRAVIHGVAAGLERTVVDLFMWFAPVIEDREVARRIVEVAFMLMQGAAVSRLGGFGDPDEVITLVRAVAHPAMDAIESTANQPPPMSTTTDFDREPVSKETPR